MKPTWPSPEVRTEEIPRDDLATFEERVSPLVKVPLADNQSM